MDMYYGWTRFIKFILPKRLFYRSLIIVAAPIILLQITIATVFFDSLWIKANKGMIRSIVNEIRTIINVYELGNEEQSKMITRLYNKNFDFIINAKKYEILPDKKKERWFSPIDRSLRRELKSKFGNSYWFDNTSYKELLDLRIKYKDGVLQVLIPKFKLSSSSARIFGLWITLPAVLLIFIAICSVNKLYPLLV